MPFTFTTAHGVAAAACALLAGLLAAGSAAAVDVRFVTPKHLSTVVGPSTIELAVTGAADDPVERIELSVDGEPLATLTGPPWQASWDSGSAATGHTIEAVAHLRSGATRRAVVRTSRLRVDQFESVDLVSLYAIVLDRGEDYVTGLEADDFRVFENGRRQTIERFTTERKPLRVAIVLDTSSTMEDGKKLEAAREAALEFLDVLQPGDEGMLVTFNDSVQTVQDLTSDTAELARAIEQVPAGGGTALYDAIWRTARKLEDFDGRRILVLLSDGRDESYDGLAPGSLHTLEEALEQAQRSDAMVFSIGLGSRLDRTYELRFGNLHGESNQNVQRSQEAILRLLAESTGGRALISKGSRRLRRAFNDVAADLHHQYTLAYDSTDEARDGSWRAIEVTVPGRPSLEVVTRDGYYAADDRGDGQASR